MTTRAYRRVRLGLISVALLLFLLGVTAARLAYDFVEANKWVRHTEDVMMNVRATRSLLGLSRLPGPSTQKPDIATIRAQLDRIAKLTNDNPGQQKNLADLRATLALPQPSQFDRDTIFKTQAADAVTLVLDRMQREEYGLLLERSGVEARAMQRAGLAVLALCLGLIALGIFTTIAARKEFLRREMIEAVLRAEKKELTRYSKELALISKGGEVIQAAQDEKGLSLAVVTVLRELLPDSSGYLGLVRSAQQTVEIAESWGETALVRTFSPTSSPTSQDDAAAQIERKRYHANLADVPVGTDDSLCVPIRGADELIGILHVKTPGPLLPRQADSITLFSAQVALGLTNLRIRETLHNESVRDSLTGLFNRRYFDDALEREMAVCRRYNTSLAVLMLDLDHFKSINDSQGHAAGDDVLREFARIMRSAFRESDVVCRYGGEEFAVIIHTGMQDGFARAEGFRKLVADADLIPGRLVTTSIGLASSTEFATPGELLQAADSALYQAKNNGRNRTCCTSTAPATI